MSLINIRETAEILGVSVGLVYRAAREGQIPVLQIGRRLVVPRAALDRMLSGHPLGWPEGEESVPKQLG